MTQTKNFKLEQLRPPPPFCLNPRLQAELDRFKEIQKNPHVLFQTLREMERRKQREKNFRRDLCHICGAMIRSLCTHLKVHFGHPCHIGNCQDVFKSNLKLIEHRKVVHCMVCSSFINFPFWSFMIDFRY